jgi:uncharacterized protein YjiK
MFYWLSYKILFQVMMFIILLFIFACANNNTDNNRDKKRSNFNLESKNSVKLSKKLHELSGLAMTNDGRLFGHNDEKAEIFQIDYSDGSIIKSFSLGKKSVKKDFEGIAIVDDIFFLVSSSGEIFEFSEGEDNSSVPYEKYKTRLTSKNNVEGLCYDPESNSLLLACKEYPGKSYDGKRAVYAFSLTEKKLNIKPRFLISIEEVNSFKNTGFAKKLGDFFLLTEDSFAPSGIEKHPQKNSFFLLSFHGRMIVEISSVGKIIGVIFLDKKYHNQPEGITFSEDLSLLIGDEGGKGKATITKYAATGTK